jgi:glycosyltransferase involved in cell wall biosynthesis
LNYLLQETTPAVAIPSTSDPVWIVIPAYNEARRLPEILKELCLQYSNVVVVDDGSTDDTEARAVAQGAWVLRHLLNRGQGAALQTGIEFALARGAATLVTFDADGQHSVSDIPSLIEPIGQDQADVVLGSRFLGQTVGMPWSRWLILKLGILFTRVFSRIRVTDTHNGLRALSRSAAQRLRITQDRMAHASEILDEIRVQGLRYCEVPVTVRYSADSLAKGQSSRNALAILGELLLSRIMR